MILHSKFIILICKSFSNSSLTTITVILSPVAIGFVASSGSTSSLQYPRTPELVHSIIGCSLLSIPRNPLKTYLFSFKDLRFFSKVISKLV